ncbi:hypothetical protein CEXT_745621 [Caerostris extrusa]|uniref:Uncharacterized protein n=1 Tax=Caerostris extrusa TaxID=172846 RepID=A0AAV4MID1_CAEEX|nr:hypothetical protein CEXT_745621 [Caerostris extrusa]
MYSRSSRLAGSEGRKANPQPQDPLTSHRSGILIAGWHTKGIRGLPEVSIDYNVHIQRGLGKSQKGKETTKLHREQEGKGNHWDCSFYCSLDLFRYDRRL